MLQCDCSFLVSLPTKCLQLLGQVRIFENYVFSKKEREKDVILHMWKILNSVITNDLGTTFHYNLRFDTFADGPTTSSSTKQPKCKDIV